MHWYWLLCHQLVEDADGHPLLDQVEALPGVEDAQVGVGVEAPHELVPLVQHVGFERVVQLAKCLAEIGGPGYLSELCNYAPTSIHLEYYARIVKDHGCYPRQRPGGRL